jgi:hypothetical protein
MLRLHTGSFYEVCIVSCNVGKMILFLEVDWAVVPVMVYIITTGITIQLIQVLFQRVTVGLLGSYACWCHCCTCYLLGHPDCFALVSFLCTHSRCSDACPLRLAPILLEFVECGFLQEVVVVGT